MATMHPGYVDVIRRQTEMVKELNALTARLANEFTEGDVEAFDATCDESERLCDEIGVHTNKASAMMEDYKRQLAEEEAASEAAQAGETPSVQ